MKHVLALLLLFLTTSACSLSSSYITPGRAADLRRLAPTPSNDASIEEALARKPAAGWPATLATVRVQDGGYRSASWEPRSSGGTATVVGVREIETPEQLARLKALPQVRDIAVASTLIFPEQIRGELDLRTAAAKMQADLLLVYTLDTRFSGGDAAPFLALITLGIAPTKVESVTSTAQCILLDVRSGFFYGAAEATEKLEHNTSQLLGELQIERTRLKLETKAFDKLVTAFEAAWPEIVARHATPSP